MDQLKKDTNTLNCQTKNTDNQKNLSILHRYLFRKKYSVAQTKLTLAYK
jgi:hypothetical protein